MKVLTLTSLYPNNKQPLNGIFNKERVRCLSELCEVKVVAPVPYFPPIRVNKKWYTFSQVAKKELIEGIDVYHPRRLVIPKIGMALYGFFYFFSVLGKMLAIQKEFNFDVIDTHFGYPDAFAAILLGKLLKKPVVVTIHGSDINLYPRYYLIRKQLVYTLKNASKIIAVCQALKERMIALGIQESKIEVIHNGVDLKKFSPVDKLQARKELNLPLDKKTILSIGALIERKGFHYLIDAISNIKQGRDNSDLLLILIGEGPYRDRLESQIKRLNLQGEIKLIGQISHNELYKWHSASDLFALASSSEGWPTVFFEALACGRPIVATKVGGAAEAIWSEDYGILVNKQDKDELAEKMTRALHNNWDVHKIVNYARQNSWENITEKIFHEFRIAAGSKDKNENEG